MRVLQSVHVTVALLTTHSFSCPSFLCLPDTDRRPLFAPHGCSRPSSALYRNFYLLPILPSQSHTHTPPPPPHRLGKSSALLWYFLHPANWITIRDVIRGGSFYFVFSVQSFIRTWVRALIDRFMSPWRRQAWRKVVPGVPEVQAQYYLETLVFLEDHAAAISLWLPTVVTIISTFRDFPTNRDETTRLASRLASSILLLRRSLSAQ